MATTEDGTRKSGRKRQVSKKYSLDPLEGLDFDGDEPLAPVAGDDSGEDQDAEFEAEQDDEDDEDDFDDNEAGLEDEDDDEDAEGIADENDAVAYDDDDALPTPRRTKSAIACAKTRMGKLTNIAHADPSKKLLSRGLLDTRIRGSKDSHRMAIFGPTEADQQPALQAHYRWNGEPTLPSRKANASGFGGFHRGYYRTEAMRKLEMEKDWVWYDDEGGRAAFEQGQQMATIESQTGKAYLPPDNQPLGVVMGPVGRQAIFKLPNGSSLNLNEPFRMVNESGQPRLQDPKTIRHGWMLNVGARVQCIEWAPNQEGKHQYLAVATVPLKRHATGEHDAPGSGGSAFTAQPLYKTSIQIWRFVADELNYPCEDQAPTLHQVICTEWGDIKSFKWCPAPRKSLPADDTKGHHLGLLAGVWMDGSIRVLDVYVPTTIDSSPQFLHCKVAAFEARPPNTIFTCLTWLSTKSVAGGCADGCVGIFHIPTDLEPVNPQTGTIPLIFATLQSSYILSITSAYPSRSQILLSTTAAGYMSMTDLSDVTASSGFNASNTVYSSRSRIPKPVVQWHDWSQMAITVDDSYTLQSAPLRRFYGISGLTRYRSGVLGQAAMAVSPVHPFVMAGTVGGEAVSHNPIRRALNVKAEIFNSYWFVHEWRRTVLPDTTIEHSSREDNGGDTEMIDAFEESVRAYATAFADGKSPEEKQDPGLVRITESYKTEPLRLQNAEEAYKNHDRGTAYTTIFEAETAVTAVCWNPNINVGGWCAAGMATGLVRVEDVARG